jgi:Fic family protein
MPFKPKHTITDKILNNISRIASGREFIENSRLIPKWELKLQKEARIHNAHSSTSIEGNQLTLKQVYDLSEGRNIAATAKDRQEVVNYLKALDTIPEYADRKAVDIRLFLEVHRTITADTLRNPDDCGVFRNKQVFVGRRIFNGTGFKEIVEYMPPKTEDVPALVEGFLNWLNSAGTKTINPIILAGITHYEVARIHPFIDGNGRTARLMASIIVYKRGFDHRRFFALDDYYDQDRAMYYAALKTAQKDKGDITRWLEYFTDGVLYSVETVKEQIMKLGILPGNVSQERVELTKKQVMILEKIREKGRISNKNIRELLGISRQAILKEMNKLVDAGIIQLVGRGRNAYYKIKE